MKSETPQTDSEILSQLDANLMGDYLARLNRMIPFAQQLERELHDAKQQMVGLRREIEHQKARAAAMPNEKS